MVGEMHGTNEPAQFVTALANLLANKGDSVQVGLEIPADQMRAFLTNYSEKSICESDFFAKPLFQSGRESIAWAHVIAGLMQDSRIKIFFFDVNAGEDKTNDRDSMMYLNIKKAFISHPKWKIITLSGNVHAMTSPQAQLGSNTMASFLKQDKGLNCGDKICSINHYYLQGACRANFGHGLEERKLGRDENEYDTTLDVHQYLVLVSATSTYPYSGFYYTRNITPSKMVHPE
jgi:hypothetical protein